MDLREAALLDLEEAKGVCGGDGLGCPMMRAYFDGQRERRYSKCGQCPMDALYNIRGALRDDPDP